MTERKSGDGRQESAHIENNSDSHRKTGTGLAPVGHTRRALVLGAVATSAVVSVRPALAQTASSVLTCEITVPAPEQGPIYVDAYGNIVDKNTQGATLLQPRTFKGEQVRRGRIRGPRAYRDLIRRLRPGMSGFTCYASIQGRRFG
ncbi:MAG: hypothetical protein AAFX04_07315 [Pseudomonadota bacterium]